LLKGLACAFAIASTPLNQENQMSNHTQRNRYVRCINNQAYVAYKDQPPPDHQLISLTVGQIYKVAPPAENDGDMLRVIDNEGEDYLYPADYFEPVQINGTSRPTDYQVTVHLDEITKGILHAEALAAHKSVSALIREWIIEHLDLPFAA
jgi:hypothetical protein